MILLILNLQRWGVLRHCRFSFFFFSAPFAMQPKTAKGMSHKVASQILWTRRQDVLNCQHSVFWREIKLLAYQCSVRTLKLSVRVHSLDSKSENWCGLSRASNAYLRAQPKHVLKKWNSRVFTLISLPITFSVTSFLQGQDHTFCALQLSPREVRREWRSAFHVVVEYCGGEPCRHSGSDPWHRNHPLLLFEDRCSFQVKIIMLLTRNMWNKIIFISSLTWYISSNVQFSFAERFSHPPFLLHSPCLPGATSAPHQRHHTQPTPPLLLHIPASAWRSLTDSHRRWFRTNLQGGGISSSVSKGRAQGGGGDRWFATGMWLCSSFRYLSVHRIYSMQFWASLTIIIPNDVVTWIA